MKSNACCFIGHRHIYHHNLKERLYAAVECKIKEGCKFFTMGTQGEFDNEALSVCRELRRKYNEIIIEVVITSFAQIKPIVDHDEIYGDVIFKPYEDVKTIMYEIEETHYKRKIIESNRQMINNCGNLICYVDEKYKSRSGALAAYKYAKKKGLYIVNLY